MSLALQVLVLAGEPGSGKTTQLPQILLDAGYHVLSGQPGQVKSICCSLADFTPVVKCDGSGLVVGDSWAEAFEPLVKRSLFHRMQ